MNATISPADPARRTALASAAALLASCTAMSPTRPTAMPVPPGPATAAGGAPAGDTAVLPPPAPREFRGVWVATVGNIDWPSRPGLSIAALCAEALALLDRARSIGLNAVVLQVRPAGDAIYPSSIEPYSEYLSGEQGRAPGLPGEAPVDLLAFWVDEAHKRALELHAWFNPYRARHSTARSPLAPTHLALRRPETVKAYGDQLWMDPGEPQSALNTLAVVADVVRRYDVDGVHIDDYFYPYPVKQGELELPFPDDESYARHRLAGGLLAREDWRRANVDALVQALRRTVQETRPWVRVGISPFGLGRPDRRPSGVSGFSQYDKLYADVERWLENGWLDYLAPQLYWPMDRPGQPFAVLLDYWLAENRLRRHVWPGLYTSQVARNDPAAILAGKAWPARELLDQVQLQRSRPAAGGHIHFSIAALMQDRDGIATQLRDGPYAQPALVPATTWLDATVPAAPQLRLQGARVLIEPGAGEVPVRWAVWRQRAGAWRFEVLPGAERSLDAGDAERVAVSAVSRVGNTSAAQVLRLAGTG